MRHVFLGLLLLSGCVTTPALPSASPTDAKPVSDSALLKLEKLEVRVGLSEPEFDRVIREHLPELVQCIAFGHWVQGGLVKVTNPEKHDDRVQVVLDHEPFYGDPELDGDRGPFKADVEAMLSDTYCVKRLVGQWPWPKEQIEAAERLRRERGPLATFLYRFRPTAAQREAARKENQASFDAFCNTPVEGDLLAHYERVKGRMKGAVLSTFDPTFRAVVHAAPADRATIVAASVREIAEQYDLPVRCAATRGLIPLSTAEYLEEPGRPTLACADRVNQMKAIASKPLGFAVAGVKSSHAQKLTEPGELMDFETESYLDEPELSARSAAAAKAQKRKRPIAYVFITDALASPRALAEFAVRVGTRFELRLMVWHESPKATSYSSTAWPGVVAQLRAQLSDGARFETLPGLLSELERDQEQYCPGLAASFSSSGDKPATYRRAPEPLPPLEVVVGAIASRLEACGCPQPYAELTWARVAALLDDQLDHVGWVPLNLTTDRKAKQVSLPDGATLQLLVDLIGDAGPYRVTGRF